MKAIKAINFDLLNQIQGQITDTMAVTSINPYNIPKCPTGIQELDGKLCGGIPKGQLTLIAGYEGSGKSHFISQIIAEALNMGEYAFITSGEQSAQHTKHILQSQLAGKHMMIEKTALSGKKYHELRQDASKCIQQEYQRQAIYYTPLKNGNLAYTTWKRDMERAAEAGVKLFVVDNLMTMMSMYSIDSEGRGLSENAMQGNIAQYLEYFAAEYDVYVVLAVHKRKTNSQGPSFNLNQEILGSSNVANSAGLILHYDAVQGSDGDQEMTGRVARITKNRLFGLRDYRGTDVKYDTVGKRLYTEGQEPRKYSWLKKFYSLTENNEKEKETKTEELPKIAF